MPVKFVSPSTCTDAVFLCAEVIAKRRESKVLQGLKEAQKAHGSFGAPYIL